MFYELVKLLLPHVAGLTEDAVTELFAAIEQHQAEHEALVNDLAARTPGSPAGASPSATDSAPASDPTSKEKM